MAQDTKVLREAAKALHKKWTVARRRFAQKRIFLYAPGASEEERREIERRASFYLGPDHKISKLGNPLPTWILWNAPVLTFGPGREGRPWFKRWLGVFDVDMNANALEAWEWFEAAVYLEGTPDRDVVRQRFDRWRGSIASTDFEKVYLFGTGPSLAKAIEHDWSDGLRIVCNTIVRDPELWHHIKPHAIVAADALYHFGPTEFARAFRRDLLTRLRESPDVVFFYPDIFHSVVAAEIAIEEERLIPVQKGQSIAVHRCLSEDFTLPALGNVLNLMLLPVGCALGKHIKLWGFDGRAPTDTLFWANSNKHSYPELMSSLKEAHPAFFNHFVPANDPESYVRSVHGDVLEHCLTLAEADGWTFEMLHMSWTPTLERRRAADKQG